MRSFYDNNFSNMFRFDVFCFLLFILSLLLILIFILMAAFLTLYERQTLAAAQRRKGPNVVGFLGLLQAFADAFKLLFKEQTTPTFSVKRFFLGASLYVVLFAIFIWAAVPLAYGSVILDIDLGFLYLLSSTGVSVYGVIVAGWSSNSRYSFLGALRACAQLLSYELAASIILLQIFLLTGTLNVTEIVEAQSQGWFFFALCPSFFIWFVCTLAETYRAPFDLSEAESELVSGFNVEYSAMTFAFLFLGEYLHVIIMSNITVLLFFGGWLPPHEFFSFIPSWIWYSVKTSLVLFIIIWIRATFPRFRYDQLMSMGWKIFLPLSCGLFLSAVVSIIIAA